MADLTLCACGSGLKRLRCCELELITLSLIEATAYWPRLMRRWWRGLWPGREDALCLLYRLCRQQNRMQAVEALIRCVWR
jgi:hypothetical protein